MEKMFKKKLSIKILETIQVFIAINYRLRYCLLIIILTLKQCILFLLMLERTIWIGKIYIAEKSNFEILQDLLFTAYTNLSVLCETD